MTEDDDLAVARALEPEAFEDQSQARHDALRVARAAIDTLKARGWQPPSKWTAWLADDSTLWRMSPEGRMEPIIHSSARRGQSINEMERYKQQRLGEIKTLTRCPDADDKTHD